MKTLERFMGSRVEWKKNGKRSYVGETVKHLGQLEAGSGCTATTIEVEVERNAQE